MDKRLKQAIVKMLGENRIMTVATLRLDGSPFATVTGYANDGLILYFFAPRQGRKASHIAHDPRVSVAVGKDSRHPLETKWLSATGSALIIEDQGEADHARALLLDRYPELRVLPRDIPQETVLVRITPDCVSMLNHELGYGHNEVVKVSSADLDEFVEAHRRHWVGPQSRKG